MQKVIELSKDFKMVATFDDEDKTGEVDIQAKNGAVACYGELSWELDDNDLYNIALNYDLSDFDTLRGTGYLECMASDNAEKYPSGNAAKDKQILKDSFNECWYWLAYNGLQDTAKQASEDLKYMHEHGIKELDSPIDIDDSKIESDPLTRDFIKLALDE